LGLVGLGKDKDDGAGRDGAFRVLFSRALAYSS
jgi:hypothetical protein